MDTTMRQPLCTCATISRWFSRHTNTRVFSSTPHKPLYIATPIFYVNGSPHIGHLYTAVIADTYARYNRVLLGKQVYLLTGTDEYGIKVYNKALEQSYTPATIQQYCDTVSSQFRALFDRCGIQYDRYWRTTERHHRRVVHAVWRKLLQKDYIYQSAYTGYYSQIDECFVTELQTRVDDDGRRVTVESGAPVELVDEVNYKFRLSRLQPFITAYLQHDIRVLPESRATEMLNWMDKGGGLEDISVSRPKARVSWAIDVPTDSEQTIYVWLDALFNYLSAVCTVDDDGNLHAGPQWPVDYHIIGKDILRFHTVYWPAFLHAMNISTPQHYVVHSHWTVNNQKMSKSLGNVIDPNLLIDTYGVDNVRMFLLSQGSIYDDCNYSANDMIKSCNMLADVLGNLLLRVTSPKIMPDQVVHKVSQPIDEATQQMIDVIHTLSTKVGEQYSMFQFHHAIHTVMQLLRQCNSYFDSAAPWKLRKTDSARCDNVANVTLQCVRVACILLQPVIPTATDNLLTQLCVQSGERTLQHATFDHDWSAQHLQLSNKPVFNKFKL